MPMGSVGIITVTTAGTPVRLSATSIPCNRISVTPVKSGGPVVQNAGAIYVGTKSLVRAAGVNVVYILQPSQPAATIPASSEKQVLLDDVSNYWVDADNNGDGVLVSYS